MAKKIFCYSNDKFTHLLEVSKFIAKQKGMKEIFLQIFFLYLLKSNV